MEKIKKGVIHFLQISAMQTSALDTMMIGADRQTSLLISLKWHSKTKTTM